MLLLLLLMSLWLCPTLCDPIDGSLPGSPISGILQARTMEWGAIAFSNAWKWKVKEKSLRRVWLEVNPWTAAYQALGKSTGVGCHCLLRCNHHRTEQLYFRHLFQRKEKLTFTEKPVHEYLRKLWPYNPNLEKTQMSFNRLNRLWNIHSIEYNPAI